MREGLGEIVVLALSTCSVLSTFGRSRLPPLRHEGSSDRGGCGDPSNHDGRPVGHADDSARRLWTCQTCRNRLDLLSVPAEVLSSSRGTDVSTNSRRARTSDRSDRRCGRPVVSTANQPPLTAREFRRPSIRAVKSTAWIDEGADSDSAEESEHHNPYLVRLAQAGVLDEIDRLWETAERGDDPSENPVDVGEFIAEVRRQDAER